MTDEQLNDLKQFFRTEVSQSEARIKTGPTADLTASLGGQINELREEIGKLRQEMHEGFAAVGDAIAGIHDKFDNHETRITVLEHKPA
ncbi:MAG TPA: hypothetical protein VK978_00140 [Candidatus Saccharimonadales bacterium]|nr:hypothetical protein [Candidatus Saccharimonadales bacterium]